VRCLVCVLCLVGFHPVIAGPPPRSEVVVLGTIHAPWQFRSANYTPAHIRAALARLKPDLIGVESNPTWFAAGMFHDVTYEAQVVGVQYSKAHGVPVHGIDWMQVEAWDRREQGDRRRRVDRLLGDRKRGHLHLWHFGQVQPSYLGKVKEFFDSSDFDYDVVNEIKSDEYGRQWLRGDPKSPKLGGHRNRQIAKHCVELIERNPGKRLVVVIGAGHKAVLDKLFEQHDGIAVVNAPALTKKQVDAAWTHEDLLVTLGHNLDGERSYFHPELVDLDRMASLLKRLKNSPAKRYFAARLLMARGKHKEAARALGKLAGVKEPPALYPFPLGHWRMQYGFGVAVELERARCLRALGKTEEARRALRALKTGIAEPQSMAAPRLEATTRVRNPRFADALAANPTQGWNLPKSFEKEVEIGRGGPGIEVTTRNARAAGSFFLSQIVAAKAGERVEIRLDAEPVGEVTASLVTYVWIEDENRVEELASAPVGKGTTRCAATVPVGHDHVIVYVYFNGPKCSGLKLRSARAYAGTPAPPIPESWIPHYLAREFPKSLANG
jgi:hypothetical protein